MNSQELSAAEDRPTDTETPENGPTTTEIAEATAGAPSQTQDGTLEAFVADEVLEATGVAVILSDEEQEKVDRKRRRKILMLGGVGLVILIIAIVVPVTLLTGDSETKFLEQPPSAAPSGAPSAVPSQSPTTGSLQTIVRCLKETGISNPASFDDSISPQYRAAEWLADVDSYGSQDIMECDSPRFQQRFALATFYFAMNGDDWTRCGQSNPLCGNAQQFSFLSNTDHCTWYNIGCDDQGLVSVLDFSSSSTPSERAETPLTGEFPVEMSYLSSMTRLVLHDFEIKGSIDGPFRTWSMVSIFDVSRNQLTGAIPQMIGTDSPVLSELIVSQNGFSGPIPTSLSDLLLLLDLRIDDNIFNMPLPENFGVSFERLGNLDFRNSSITGVIPSGIWGLPNLRNLEMNGNPNLSGNIPTEVGLMQKLSDLAISGTQISGNIPAELYNTPMSSFEADGCQLTGPLLAVISKWNATLRHFVVSNNDLTGEVPSDSFAMCEDLEILKLEGNRLTGSITQDLCMDKDCPPTAFGCLSTISVDCVVDCDCCEPRPDCPA